jgi:hypothetical protein
MVRSVAIVFIAILTSVLATAGGGARPQGAREGATPAPSPNNVTLPTVPSDTPRGTVPREGATPAPSHNHVTLPTVPANTPQGMSSSVLAAITLTLVLVVFTMWCLHSRQTPYRGSVANASLDAPGDKPTAEDLEQTRQAWRDWVVANLGGPEARVESATRVAMAAVAQGKSSEEVADIAQNTADAWDSEMVGRKWRDWVVADIGGPEARVETATKAATVAIAQGKSSEEVAAAAQHAAAAWSEPAPAAQTVGTG